MKRLAYVMLLLNLFWIRSSAQEMPRYSPATRDPGANSHALKTRQVCLESDNGKTTFTDNGGKKYEAISDRVSLPAYVGQNVKITGYLVNPEDPSNAEMSNNAAGAKSATPAFYVSEIEKIADTCSPSK
jgi:hypothetical protein